jgi:alkanesulfonate monooxygenase SsuD/methylene tetrahydromethanopterin reductase-like flavin-dependent oxidoreductase (luciferase family)
VLWRDSPASFEGRHFRFSDVWLEPKPSRPEGPALWFGGQTMHERLLRRLGEFGSGFNPLGSPSDEDLERLRSGMAAAGRDTAELEMVGGTRGRFAGPEGVADLSEALASIPAQLERGFTTICIKPSQFIDDPNQIGTFCRDVVERVDALDR